MNKHILHTTLLLVAVTVSLLLTTACNKNNNKTTVLDLNEYETDYGELAEKYAAMDFKTCADAIAAGNEIASALYATADKAMNENDAKAKADLDNFEELVSEFYSAIETLRHECPTDIETWEKNNRKKIDDTLKKFSEKSHIHENDTTFEDVSSEIEAVNEQVEQLKIDMQRFAEEDDSINNLK